MNLFELVDYKVQVAPEALLLKPFKAIWERDKSRTKTRAENELAAIYFFTDERSDYWEIRELEERAAAIADALEVPKDWYSDAVIRAAIDYYMTRQPESVKALDDAVWAVEKVRRFLRTVDLTERDQNGKPIWNPKQIAEASAILPKMERNIKEARKEIARERIAEKNRVGSKEKGVYEDGI